MDDLNSNHSNELCDQSDSWIPCWETQLAGTGGEINLVEDKEIASRAVAFVVNSTRKGIVPLCTDVANLLRAKRSKSSPTPASLSSDKSIHDTSYHIQEPYRPPSRCSQCSSTISDSPKVRQRPESQQRSPISSRHNGTNASPLSQRLRADSLHGQQEQPVQNIGPLNETEVQKPTTNGLMTKAEVHVESKPTVHTSGHYDKHNIDKKNDRYHRISQKSKQIKYEVEDNRNNYDELFGLESTFDAEKDLKYITECLQQIEVKQCLDKLYIENELHSNPDNKVKGSKLYMGSKQKAQSVNKKWSRALSPSVTSVCSQPIKGCKCSRCESAVRSGDEDVNDAQKFSVSYKLQVQQGDYVVAKGDKTGRICYIGHLDNTPDVLYVGLELAQPVGQHDGFYKSKRYYTCKKDHGIFVPLQEILCKVNKKVYTSQSIKQDIYLNLSECLIVNGQG
ncbi:unnamed protein product [Mytilus edulis]|uniref:CAP-Gly domain-containing protein n=1 Tax=Mytilus edulis TaxID=6550 RepID=A0A8S3T282_MYTED|nr:unnamed protein product [Mytilus edulis]